jgi:DNA-binding NarL/FixJ family response regulator
VSISVLIVDDHPIIRKGLSDLFRARPEFQVVGAASDGAEAVRLARENRPHVVLMDLSMPGIDGVEATRQVLDVSPDSKVVILTSFTEADRITEAVDAGAIGYLLKDAEPDALVAGVRSAAAGDAPFDARAARALLPAQTKRRPEHQLTLRELEILKLVVAGLPNKSIARHLGISEKTVKAHLTSVFSTIGVTDRTSAAVWAERNGLGGTPG